MNAVFAFLFFPIHSSSPGSTPQYNTTMQNFAFATFLLCLAGTVMALPALSPARQMTPIDVEAIHNKVRAGAVAVANAENPRSGRVEYVAYNNGDRVDVIDDRETLKAGEEMLLYETAVSDEYYDLDY